MKSGEGVVEEALLEGHLGITRELLSLQSAEKKYNIGSEKGGSNLIKVSLSYLLFSVLCSKIEQKMFQVVARDIFCLIFTLQSETVLLLLLPSRDV